MNDILKKIRRAVSVEEEPAHGILNEIRHALDADDLDGEDGDETDAPPPFRLDRLAFENWRILLLFAGFTGVVTGGAVSLVNLGLQPYVLGDGGIADWAIRLGGRLVVLGAGAASIFGLSRAFAASLDEDAFRPFDADQNADRLVDGIGWFASSYVVITAIAITVIDIGMTRLLDIAVVKDLTDILPYMVAFYGGSELNKLLKRFGRMRPPDAAPAA